MKQRLSLLAERRRRLVAQAAAQRTALAHDLQPWRARLALVDQGVAVFRTIGRHPALIVGAALLLVGLRPRRAGNGCSAAGWRGSSVAGCAEAENPPAGSDGVPQHGEIMAGGSGQDEQMPDEMAVAQARIEREKDHPQCVGQAAGDQP